MLQIKNLTITHKRDNRILLNNISFVLNDGDKAAIIGEEGNGKSTLLKLIYDERLVEDYADYTGEIVRNNNCIGYLPQELSVSEREMSVYEFMCQLPTFYELTPKELGDAARKLNLSVELFYSEQKIGELSGGEKIKICLARLNLQQPDALLLDEPSNDLDISSIQWLEKFIRESAVPVLYISHDETLLENTANKIIHVEQLKRKQEARATVESVGYREYVDNRKSSFGKQEQLARKERAEYEKQQEKFRQIQQKVEYQQNVVTRQAPHVGALLKKTMHRIKAYEARFEKEFADMTQMPESEDAIFVKFGEKAEVPAGKVVLDFTLPKLTVGERVSAESGLQFEGNGLWSTEGKLLPESNLMSEGRVLAENVFLYVRGPEKICIIGRNGCGKTTLLRIIAKELLKRKDIKVSYMPQNYEELLDLDRTPVEFLSETGDKEEITRIRTYLGSMKYTADEMQHCIRDLSGGQKAKILLLKMSMSGSNVLILDEPTRNFSPLSNPVIREMLKNFNGAILSISHDRKYIEEVADKVYELTERGLEQCEKPKLLS